MENSTDKRYKFLREFEKSYRKIKNFDRYAGGGFANKIKRALFSPKIYIPYVLGSLRLFSWYSPQTRLFFGRKIRFALQDRGAVLFHCIGLWVGEYCLTKFLIKNLKEEDIYYDIGANHGFYSYLALEFCKKVYSFEPLPSLCNELVMNTKNDKNIVLNRLALSNRSGKTLLYTSISSGLSTINKEIINLGYKKRGELEVHTITLDQYIKDHDQPTIIKIDVEGSEKMVLEGGQEFFQQQAPLIVIELWREEERRKFSESVIDLLTQWGYRLYGIDQNGDIYSINGKWFENNINSEDNFVFIKNKT